ncbi:MAG: glycosyltransferase [Acidobacteriota bacterium]
METWIVMRSHNDMPLVVETLARVKRQNHDFQLLVLDNQSSDGTTQEAEKYAHQLLNIPQGTYVPGRVLNQGMRLTDGEFVVFLNSDCTPQNDRWLEELLKGFHSDKVAAVFGRQIPRTDCQPLYAKDTEDTFGDGERQKYWRHCFSMASSAIRRSVWEKMPFNEQLHYSEDIEWTWRAKQAGYEVEYVPQSVVSHSHNYSLKQFYKRQFGEGRADAAIFAWENWQKSFLRYSLLPFTRQVLSDLQYCLSRREFKSAGFSPFLRMSQLLGRRAGFVTGLKESRH